MPKKAIERRALVPQPVREISHDQVVASLAAIITNVNGPAIEPEKLTRYSPEAIAAANKTAATEDAKARLAILGQTFGDLGMAIASSGDALLIRIPNRPPRLEVKKIAAPADKREKEMKGRTPDLTPKQLVTLMASARLTEDGDKGKLTLTRSEALRRMQAQVDNPDSRFAPHAEILKKMTPTDLSTMWGAVTKNLTRIAEQTLHLDPDTATFSDIGEKVAQADLKLRPETINVLAEISETEAFATMTVTKFAEAVKDWGKKKLRQAQSQQ